MFSMEWDPIGVVDRCPNVWFGPDVWEAVGWWAMWQAFQALPFPGTIYDQPYKVYQALEACEAAAVQAMSEKAKEK